MHYDAMELPHFGAIIILLLNVNQNLKKLTLV